MIETTVTIKGTDYQVSYDVFGDEVVTYLPDGTSKSSIMQAVRAL
jgi:hypothetical protein